MWGSAVSAALAVYAASQEAKKPILKAYDPPALIYNVPKPKQAKSAKCPCCGSRQFVTHQSRRVCTYCRSEQDGEPVRTATSSDRLAADRLASLLAEESKYLNMITGQYDAQFGHAVLRPEAAVRIAKL